VKPQRALPPTSCKCVATNKWQPTSATMPKGVRTSSPISAATSLGCAAKIIARRAWCQDAATGRSGAVCSSAIASSWCLYMW